MYILQIEFFSVDNVHIDERKGTEFENYRYVVKKRKIFEEGSCTGKTSSYKDKVERLVEMMHDIKTSTDEKLESKCPFEYFYQYSKISEYKIRTHIMEKP